MSTFHELGEGFAFKFYRELQPDFRWRSSSLAYPLVTHDGPHLFDQAAGDGFISHRKSLHVLYDFLTRPRGLSLGIAKHEFTETDKVY